MFREFLGNILLGFFEPFGIRRPRSAGEQGLGVDIGCAPVSIGGIVDLFENQEATNDGSQQGE